MAYNALLEDASTSRAHPSRAKAKHTKAPLVHAVADITSGKTVISRSKKAPIPDIIEPANVRMSRATAETIQAVQKRNKSWFQWTLTPFSWFWNIFGLQSSTQLPM